ncbi:MAG: [NiFe] hydrogenase metallocenter assembly protein HypC [Chloroflexi bacterium]|jgi:hydrogenase expression/formation protein HypC|nr:[NiFe] hydrogenase metallocenter assembly protein HypC [Chloroflexota bacterium]
MCLGIPGKIVEKYEVEGRQMGKVDFGGVMKETCLDFVPEAKVGDYCIIHVGFALNILDEKEALETLDLFRQIEEVGQELEPM